MNRRTLHHLSLQLGPHPLQYFCWWRLRVSHFFSAVVFVACAQGFLLAWLDVKTVGICMICVKLCCDELEGRWRRWAMSKLYYIIYRYSSLIRQLGSKFPTSMELGTRNRNRTRTAAYLFFSSLTFLNSWTLCSQIPEVSGFKFWILFLIYFDSFWFLQIDYQWAYRPPSQRPPAVITVATLKHFQPPLRLPHSKQQWTGSIIVASLDPLRPSSLISITVGNFKNDGKFDRTRKTTTSGKVWGIPTNLAACNLCLRSLSFFDVYNTIWLQWIKVALLAKDRIISNNAKSFLKGK